MTVQISIFALFFNGKTSVKREMNAMKKQFTLAILLIGLVFMQGCKGPEGPAGPAGEGTPGATGPAGPTGPAGSANVFYSSWAAAGTWSKTTYNSLLRSYIDIAAPRITQDVLDKGLVLVYAKVNTSDNYVRQLPVTLKSQFTEEYIDYTLQINTLRIWSTPIAATVEPSTAYQFRYIVVPGGQAIRMNYEGLTYEEAKVLFNIKD
ncbi:collagen-like triple helix repeat-containing protein [Dyadobacter koreensis]|nr:collagen-like protein [Dyadobacter koreensis]